MKTHCTNHFNRSKTVPVFTEHPCLGTIFSAQRLSIHPPLRDKSETLLLRP